MTSIHLKHLNKIYRLSQKWFCMANLTFNKHSQLPGFYSHQGKPLCNINALLRGKYNKLMCRLGISQSNMYTLFLYPYFKCLCSLNALHVMIMLLIRLFYKHLKAVQTLKSDGSIDQQFTLFLYFFNNPNNLKTLNTVFVSMSRWRIFVKIISRSLTSKKFNILQLSEWLLKLKTYLRIT